MIGRKREKEVLDYCLSTPKSEFIAILGRRRVGKTFLVHEVYGDKLCFKMTGVYRATKVRQLEMFCIAFERYFGITVKRKPRRWMDAFQLLESALREMPKPDCGKRVLFFDELPWLYSPKGDLLSALEHFWNSYAAWSKDLVLVVCGSATSWMIDNVVKNHGGLHNRITRRIELQPFTLREAEEFLASRNIRWSRYQIAECYMMMGGIPYYLDNIPGNGETPAMAIDDMYFAKGGVLHSEYDDLFESLYRHPEPYVALIETLAGSRHGYARKELISRASIEDNGHVGDYLNALEACGFVRSYAMFGNKSKATVYQLIDPFVIFHLNFRHMQQSHARNVWQAMTDNTAKRNWQGHAFELLCLLHTEQILDALRIGGVLSVLTSWRTSGTESYDGAEVDLVIDRRDQVINLCESKFSINEYAITDKYEAELRNKLAAFRHSTGTRKALQLTMITTFGLHRNEHCGIVTSELTLADLFTK